MENTRKIIVVKTNAVTSEGSRLFWMFSRTQLDLVLKELECTPVASREAFCEATTHWQDDILPVVCLEKYFGIFKATGSSPTRHLILKGASQEKDEVLVSKIAIPVFTDVQTGALTVKGKSMNPRFLPANSSDVLGVFQLAGKRIVVIPDIGKIASRNGMILKQQGRQ